MAAYWRETHPQCAAVKEGGGVNGGCLKSARWPRNCCRASATLCWCSSRVTIYTINSLSVHYIAASEFGGFGWVGGGEGGGGRGSRF